MKLTEMREWLDKRDIQLTKSLGQNFLHDAHQLQRIADAGEITKTDRVLEIGPGLGPLTELLLARAGEVLAIEMDARLVTVLRERFPSLNLLHADALEYIRRERRDWSDWKLVANLPYVPESERPHLQREIRDWEPEVAVFAGVDGLRLLRCLIVQAADLLSPAGALVLECMARQSGELLEAGRLAGMRGEQLLQGDLPVGVVLRPG